MRTRKSKNVLVSFKYGSVPIVIGEIITFAFCLT